MLDEGTTVFFEPPDFVDVRIASSAAGHASARAAFQLGLYESPETEVAFPDLDAVREFVRRLYLRSSGDSAPPGGEGPPPPLPDQPQGPDAPEFSRLEVTESDPSHLLGEFGKAFLGASAKVKGVAERFERPLNLSKGKALVLDRTRNALRLTRAAVRLLWELKRRAPVTRRNEDDWLLWTRSAATLARGLDRLQLWPLLERNHGGIIGGIASYLLSPIGSEIYLLRHLMLAGWVSDRIWPRVFDEWSSGSDPAGSWQASRPFDTLDALPVPRSTVEGLIPGRSSEATSLRHLLLAATAKPQLLVSPDAPDADNEARTELLYFAACWLASFAEPGRQASYPDELRLPESVTGSVALAERHLARISSVTLDWLPRNLPSWVFAPQYEDMIDEAVVSARVLAASTR